jgi:hypothetical protein
MKLFSDFIGYFYIAGSIKCVSGHLKPARDGHFLKPKTSHPLLTTHKIHFILSSGFNRKGETLHGEQSQNGKTTTNSSTYKLRVD